MDRINGLASTCQKTIDVIRQLQDHIEELHSENDQLRSEKFKEFNSKEYWIWQGDGYDNLESLWVPVVIHPKALLSIINQAENQIKKLTEQHAFDFRGGSMDGKKISLPFGMVKVFFDITQDGALVRENYTRKVGEPFFTLDEDKTPNVEQ